MMATTMTMDPEATMATTMTMYRIGEDDFADRCAEWKMYVCVCECVRVCECVCGWVWVDSRFALAKPETKLITMHGHEIVKAET